MKKTIEVPLLEPLMDEVHKEFVGRCDKCKLCFDMNHGTYVGAKMQKCKKVSKLVKMIYKMKDEGVLISEFPVLIRGEVR